MNIAHVAPRTIAILSAAFLVLQARAVNHIQWTNAFVHVGSGNMAFGGIPRAPCLLPATSNESATK